MLWWIWCPPAALRQPPVTDARLYKPSIKFHRCCYHVWKTNHKTASSAFVSYSWIVKRRVDPRVELNSESSVTCESVHALQHLPDTNSLVSGGCFMLAAGSINKVPLLDFPCVLFLPRSCLNNISLLSFCDRYLGNYCLTTFLDDTNLMSYSHLVISSYLLPLVSFPPSLSIYPLPASSSFLNSHVFLVVRLFYCLSLPHHSFIYTAVFLCWLFFFPSVSSCFFFFAFCKQGSTMKVKSHRPCWLASNHHDNRH